MNNNKNYIILGLTIVSCFWNFIAKAQELQPLLEEGLKNNPEIQQYGFQYKRASEKVKEVNALPNTEVGAGYFVSEPETRTGAQRFKVSVKQMLPWFGTIASREKYMNSVAEAKYEDIIIAKRKLISAISQSYYKLYANKAKQRVINENIALLKTYETMALTSLEVGKASTVDVLRLQMRQNELQQLKEVLEQQFSAEQSTVKNLLNRKNDNPITIVDELMIPLQDNDYDSEDLKVHPELIKHDKLYQSIEQSELLNQKESSPMIGFGLDYINVAPRPNMDFSDNGKDIVMPMISMSIPIFNKKYKSVSKQNELQQQEINYQKQERLNTLEVWLDKAISECNSARISYNTALKNLQQAKNAEDILIKNYETGTIDFNDVLDIQELQLKFQMNQIEAVKNYYMQSAIIQYLIQ